MERLTIRSSRYYEVLTLYQAQALQRQQRYLIQVDHGQFCGSLKTLTVVPIPGKPGIQIQGVA